MSQDKKKQRSNPERAVLSGRTDLELKEQLEREAPLRGHTVSQAVEHAIKLGLPLYLKRFPKQYEAVSRAA